MAEPGMITKTQCVDVLVSVDVHCKQLNQQPIYRLYVNDELFTERTWLWDNVYLEESIAISAPPGDYLIKYQVIPDNSAVIKLKNIKIAESSGSAQIIKNILRIHR
jgi:hypothetical protein